MMLKSEDDDGYCSRSSLDSPIHSIKVETISGPAFSLDCKDEEFLKQDDKGKLPLAPSFLEVMLIRDDWKKSEVLCHTSTNSLDVTNSMQVSHKKSVSSEMEVSSQTVKERMSEKEFQPRRTIKLMPSSSQNLLLFTKQSALSGLVVSSKSSSSCNPVTLHSLIKNNNNILLSNQNAQHQTSKKVSQGNNAQSIKLTAAEVLKSKISHHSDIQKKLHVQNQVQCHKKVILGKDSNSQGLNSSFTSARTSQPYIKNAKGGGWIGRPSSYVGRHELHPVIDHDYCQFSAFNAEIQSGIILMSRETCARTDRMNMKRNKANLQSPMLTAVASPTPYAKTNIIRSTDESTSPDQTSHINQSHIPESKRKYLKRKFSGPSLDVPTIPVVKNAVGRPRLSGKAERSQILGKKCNGYDSSEDLLSPPLTEDKNYVKIPGSFQNDFVYYATIRGRSSRKRHSDINGQSSQSIASSHQKNASLSNIKAFEWYKEMAKTDKSSRFGSVDKPGENYRPTKEENENHINSKLDIASLFSSPYEEGKNLISESEVADLVMQMLPSADVERSSLFQNQFLSSANPDSPCKLTSSDIIGCDSTQSLIDGIDIGNIDLNSMANELGNMLGPVQRQDIIEEQQGINSIDFPSMTSSQLLEDICENDLLMSSEIANMNAFLNEFSNDQVDICSAEEADGVLSSMIRGDVMGLLTSPEQKINGNELSQPACLTPPDSATIESNDGLSFSSDLKEFILNGNDSCVVSVSHQPGDLPTPPPSLPPSSAPPELTTVNMFWNDLPGLLIEGREYVRLVDIHKQIMPAKDTGILKKRCVMLGLEVSSCSELQRDFLIRYMNAAKSKSKVIVTKDMALELISFYVNPKMRSELIEKRPTTEVLLNERLGSGKAEAVLRDLPSPIISSVPLKDRHSHVKQMPSRNESHATSPELIKRSARLFNKRFSYLDMVNNGFPSKHFSTKNIIKPDNDVPVGDLQQQWLEVLKNKICQSAEQSDGNESDSFDKSSQADISAQSEKSLTFEPESQSSESSNCLSLYGIGLADKVEESENVNKPSDANIKEKNDNISDLPQCTNLHSEDADSNISSEFSSEKMLHYTDVVSPNNEELHLASEASPFELAKADPVVSDLAGSNISVNLAEKSSPSRWKSERVLRSSTCQGSSETTVFNMKKVAKTFPVIGMKHSYKPKNVPSNENQAPRLIRNKRRFVRTASGNNCLKRQSLRFIFKEGALLSRICDKGKLQSRPQRRSKKKFNVLKF